MITALAIFVGIVWLIVIATAWVGLVPPPDNKDKDSEKGDSE